MASAQSITFAESDQTLDKRAIKALKECMTVVKEAPGLYQVISSSGSTYTVDARDRVCECPDFKYRDEVTECKHLHRCDFATGTRVIPRWVNESEVDELLGVAVEGPIFAPEHPPRRQD